MTHKDTQDPYSKRESEKYNNPIPSREFILNIIKLNKRPLTRSNISKLLKLKGKEQIEALRRRLIAMERDEQLSRNRKNAYDLISTEMSFITGKIIGHPEGYGFLIPDKGGKDLFLSQRQMHIALHSDRAVARVTGVDRRGRKEGAIVKVLQYGNQKIVGRIIINAGIHYLIPNNRRINLDIVIPDQGLMDAKDGQIVEIEITKQPNRHSPPLGRVISILGNYMAPGMEINIALHNFELPYTWSSQTLEQSASLDHLISQSTIEARLDLRSLHLITIDGEDAHDLDDAVCAEQLRSGSWRLWVAIADVSNYVQPNTPLDKDAQKRGTSIYFPSQVIPMLPEVLSNGLCSLHPDVDRLCIVCEMIINTNGEIESYQFHKAVINSKARLSYNDVDAILINKDTALLDRHAEILPELHTMYGLYKAMLKSRRKRGAIDFEMEKPQFILDKNRKIANIQLLKRNDAHRLIEEFMVAANVSAAKFLLRNTLPSLYRVHDVPSDDKISGLRIFLGKLGLMLGGGDEPQPYHYTSLLNISKQRSDGHLLQIVMLRSLKQAIYSPNNIGHFGLALKTYAHFTSPIRRYPDILVHRAINHLISDNKNTKWRYSNENMIQLGNHCSLASRNADEATRDVTDWLKCEFMKNRVGEIYEGNISGVTGFGLFVELDNICIEGLVHITSLGNDYYQLNDTGYCLTGEHSRKVYSLGDKIHVKVVRVDLDEKKIDLEII